MTLDLIDFSKYHSIVLLTKYGMDGSSGFNSYKYKQNSNVLRRDESLFILSILPIRINGCELKTGKKVLLWNNPRPSSTRFCRPLKFIFAKETPDLIKNESDLIKSSLSKLVPSQFQISQKDIIAIQHELVFSMVDGKVMSALTGTKSSQLCVICGASPKNMNELDTVIERPITMDSLQYGLSPLHSYIRFYECILHISYRQDFEKWRVSGEDKCFFEFQKKGIQN